MKLKKSIAILYQAGTISKPKYDFTTPRRIFEKRFQCFRQFRQPPPLTFDDFQKGTDFSSVPAKDLIKSAIDTFKDCRKALDQIAQSIESEKSKYHLITKEETLSLTKVCIANSLFLLKMSQYIETGKMDSLKVSFDFDIHKQFCSIIIN